MKAVLMTAPGGPEVLQLQEVAAPKLQTETEILVRLKAAGVNPIDTKLRQRGTFYPDQMPAVLGCDGAGIVEEVGRDVQKFRVGDEVYFCDGGLGAPTGNYAEFSVVDERFAAHKPRSLSFAEAAAAPLVLITAWEALYDRGRLEAGRYVLVQAGAGGVGHVAIQLAKLAGARVCTTVSNAQKAAFVQQLGAERVVLYPTTNVVQDVTAWAEGEGVHLGFDTVGGKIFSQTIAATRTYGDVVTLLDPSPETDWKTARSRNQRVSYELMLTPMLQDMTTGRQDQAKILLQCARLIDQGQLKIHLSDRFPLADAAAAHRQIESGSTTGKVVLIMD